MPCALRTIVLLTIAALAVGCGPSDFCKFECDCLPQCYSWSLDLCRSKAIGDEQASQLLGCSEQYDALVMCRNDTAVCSTYTLFTSCDVQQNLWNKCMADAQAQGQ